MKFSEEEEEEEKVKTCEKKLSDNKIETSFNKKRNA